MSYIAYDLRNDHAVMASIQKTSLSHSRWGLRIIDDVVVTSKEWWDLLDSNRIPAEHFTGIIAQVDGGPMGDSAIVRIHAPSGDKISWCAWNGFSSDLVGKQVKITYVKVPPKFEVTPGDLANLLVRVEVVTT